VKVIQQRSRIFSEKRGSQLNYDFWAFFDAEGISAKVLIAHYIFSLLFAGLILLLAFGASFLFDCPLATGYFFVRVFFFILIISLQLGYRQGIDTTYTIFMEIMRPHILAGNVSFIAAIFSLFTNSTIDLQLLQTASLFMVFYCIYLSSYVLSIVIGRAPRIFMIIAGTILYTVGTLMMS
jgi:hypothetical protein